VLLRSLKQINNVIGIKNVISIKISENNLHLYNWGNESNVGNIDLDIIYTGEEVEVLVNPDYLLDMLSEIGTSDITFSMKDKDSVVKINVGDRPNYDYIVMPIKM
jgi:DNA polymerase-3 subunit beta